jgi:3-hydroxybutyryl-CoA dehydratase
MEPLPPVGHSVQFERTILEADVALFASLSGDRNPLHLKQEFAATTRFGHCLVHGAFLIGLISAALTRLTGPGFVYLGQEVKFRAPVFIGETVTVTASVARAHSDKPIISVETTVAKEDGTVAISGEAGLMRLDGAGP